MSHRYSRESEERSYYRQVVHRRDRRRSTGGYDHDSDGYESHHHDDDDDDRHHRHHRHHHHHNESGNRDFYKTRRPGNGYVAKFIEEEEPSAPQMVCFYTSSPNAVLNGCRVIPCATDIPGWKHVLAPPYINGQYIYGPPPPEPEAPKPFNLTVIDKTEGSRWYRYGETYQIKVSTGATGHDIVSWILSQEEDVEENDVFVRWSTGTLEEPLDYHIDLDELKRDCRHLIVKKRETRKPRRHRSSYNQGGQCQHRH